MSQSAETGTSHGVSAPQPPLTGLRVLDLSQVMAGPFCCMLLGDMGADVIKVEPPGVGDQTRKSMGFRMKGEDSPGFLALNRNKRSITLDLKTEAGQRVLHRLVETADILVENSRPGVTKKLGADYETLSKINPRLIYASISGFGQTGPYSKRAGFGAIGESMGGIRHLTGYPGMAPTRVGISLGDSLAAMYAVIGILMALYHRDVKQGGGQEIDVALYEAVFSLMESMVPEYDQHGVVRERTGSILPGIAPSNVYPTRDGKYAVIAANGDAIVQRLLKAMGREDLADDERFASNEARVRHMDFIDGLIGAWSAGMDLDTCLNVLNEHAIPAGPIYSIEDIFRDAQYQARDMILDVEHPEFGTLKVPGIVPKLSATPGAITPWRT